MAIFFAITTMLMGALFGYSVYALRLVRAELKAKNNLLRIYKTYNGEVKLP